jgi:fluoroacetyl-CoA thioesterase
LAAPRFRQSRKEAKMRPVPLGAKGTYALVAQPFHLASQFKDSILPPVFATPMMVLFMENAALNAVRDYLEPGESCVGAGIALKHLAATPAGHRIFAEATVTRIDGRRIEFSVIARDEVEVIGEGTHERVVVEMERFAKKLALKAK